MEDGKENKGGRPRKWSSVADMQSAIDAYFAQCKADKDPPTIEGLALALDFNTRTSLLNYEGYVDENGEEFLNAIKKAKSKIQDLWIKGAMKGDLNVATVLFSLKNNAGYVDRKEVKQEQHHTGDVTFNFGNSPDLPSSEEDIIDPLEK